MTRNSATASVFLNVIGRIGRPLLMHLLLLVGVGCSAPPAFAQHPTVWEPAYVHFGLENGLQGNVVYDIYKDRNGYLWFGTDMGLSRYDGYQFLNYSAGDGLTDNDVFGTREDSRGRIWVLTNTGVPCFFADGKFHNPTTDTFLNVIRANSHMSAFFEDEDRSVYLGFMDGSAYVIDSSDSVHRIPCPGFCRVMGFGSNPSLGVYMLQNINTFHSLSNPALPMVEMQFIAVLGVNNYPVKYLLLRDGGNIVTWGRNLRYVNREMHETTFSDFIEHGKILGTFLGTGSKIHIATTEGAFEANVDSLGGGLSTPVLPGHAIYSILEDPESGTWYGTDHGVFFFPRIACLKLADPDFGIPSATALLPGGNLLVGFDDGKLLEFDKGLHLIRTAHAGGFPIKSLHVRSANEIWVRTLGGIFQWTPAGLSLIQGFTPRSLDFRPTKPDELLLCHMHGWFLLDATRYREELFGDSTLRIPPDNAHPQCYCAKYGSDGELFVASAEGLFRVVNGNAHRLHDVEALSSFAVPRQILVEPRGIVWFATSGNGLIAYKDGFAKRITVMDGLSSNFVTTMTEDPRGGVWVGSPMGLQLIGANVSIQQGLSISENISEWFRNEVIRSVATNDEKLCVATDHGVYVIDKGALRGSATQLTPFLEAIKLLQGTAKVGAPFELAPHNNTLEFDFLAISYIARSNIEYRYRLLGLSDEWSLTTARFAKFQALQPGSYVFEVQARPRGADWTGATASATFLIRAPYWQTGWFIAVCSVLGIVVVLLMLYLIYFNIQRRNALVNRALVAEQKALLTQMNPHFIFNSLNSIQYFYLTNDLENANEYLADFGALIRLILENGRKQRIKLQEEIEMLELYTKLECLRLRYKFDYRITYQDLDPAKVVLPPMVLQPIVENAIWHGLAKKETKGLLRIHFGSAENRLIATIEDNGIGRKRASELKSEHGAKHESLATSITEERLEILRKAYPSQVGLEVTDLTDEDGLGCGTIVTIHLPLEELNSIPL